MIQPDRHFRRCSSALVKASFEDRAENLETTAGAQTGCGESEQECGGEGGAEQTDVTATSGCTHRPTHRVHPLQGFPSQGERGLRAGRSTFQQNRGEDEFWRKEAIEDKITCLQAS